MELIYDILKKLNNQEIRYIRQIFVGAQYEYDKVGKLFELVTQNPIQPEDFYAEKIYNCPPNNTFRVTKTRLKRMMENVMLNDKSLTGYGAEIINQQLQLRKKLLQAEILLGRGAYLAGKNLLQQCISAAKRFELYQELFQAELLMYRHAAIRVSADDYERQAMYIQELNHKSSEINEAIILHHYTSNILLHRSLNRTQLSEVKKQIDRIEGIATTTSHPLVLNAFYLSTIYYLQIEGDYNTALDFCRRFLLLIQENPTYYTRQRLANANIQLSQVALQLGQLPEAQRHAAAAFDIYHPEEMNALVTLEVMFRIAFYAKDFDTAGRYIVKAFQHPQFHASKMMNAQWHYLAACWEFQQQHYQTALKHLNQTHALLSDTYGHNLYIRIVEILILFELKSFEPLDTRIQSLGAFIRKIPKQPENSRLQLLYKLLVAWYRSGYDLVPIQKKLIQIMAELHEFHAEYPLRTTDFELIRLEQWMAAKVNL